MLKATCLYVALSMAVLRAEDQPFIFDRQWKIIMGTKCALSVLRHPAGPVVFHFDATYGCNDNNLKVVLMGLSDRAQRLHVMAIFLPYKETTGQILEDLWAEYQAMFLGLFLEERSRAAPSNAIILNAAGNQFGGQLGIGKVTIFNLRQGAYQFALKCPAQFPYGLWHGSLPLPRIRSSKVSLKKA